jgi:hypothetical protein
MEKHQFKALVSPNSPKPDFDPVALLDFADVMENLHSFKEIDIVPKQFVDYIKEDEKKVKTLVEYATGLVAVMEGSLLVYFESIYKYHDNCVGILDYFRKTLAVQIPQSWRNELTRYSGNKSHVLEQVRAVRSKDEFLRDIGTQKYLYIVDLASRILLCYNGEFNQSGSTCCCWVRWPTSNANSRSSSSCTCASRSLPSPGTTARCSSCSPSRSSWIGCATA